MAAIASINRPTTIQEFRKALAVLMFDHFGDFGTVDPCDECIEFYCSSFKAVIGVIDHNRHEGAASHMGGVFGDDKPPIACGIELRPHRIA